MTCHALALRVPASADPGPALDAAVRGWWPELPDRWPVLWRDQVPARFAEHRLRAELHRPVTEWGPRSARSCCGTRTGRPSGAGGTPRAADPGRAPGHRPRPARPPPGHRSDGSPRLRRAPKGPHRPRIDWATGEEGPVTGRAWSPSRYRPGPRRGPGPRTLRAPRPGDGLPAYATVLDEAGPVDPAFSHRLPFQSALPHLVPRGTTVELHHQLRHIDEASARAFVRHLTHVHGQLGHRPLAEIELIPAKRRSARSRRPPAYAGPLFPPVSTPPSTPAPTATPTPRPHPRRHHDDVRGTARARRAAGRGTARRRGPPR